MSARATAVLLTLTAALTMVAGAGGYTVARWTNVPRGDGAVFTPSHWSCLNRGSRIVCRNGDAYPYATLTTTPRGGITVVVQTLRGGTLTRAGSQERPAYVFSAF